MGLYRSTRLAYGFEIPATTNLDDINDALEGQPDDNPDAVGYVLVGYGDATVLCTRFTTVEENTVLRLTSDVLAAVTELAEWDAALDTVAVRLGYEDHPEPAWLVIHNYR